MRQKFNDMMNSRDNDYRHPVPEDSYSRELDSRVQASEMPYGYSHGEPSAGTHDYNERSRESKKQYPKRHGRAV